MSASDEHLGDEFVGAERCAVECSAVGAVSDDDCDVTAQSHRQDVEGHLAVGEAAVGDGGEEAIEGDRSALGGYEDPVEFGERGDPVGVVGDDRGGPSVEQLLDVGLLGVGLLGVGGLPGG